MNTIVEKITEQLQNAFAECGYDRKYAKVSLSNRPDLCEYQCNGAMAAAKEYKKAPFMIADEVVAKLDKNPLFDRIKGCRRLKDRFPQGRHRLCAQNVHLTYSR